MNTPMHQRSRHYWADAPGHDQRAAIIAGLSLPPALLPAVGAHRRLRGPYTAAGTIVRGLAAWPTPGFAALLAAHEIEILAVAPELRDRIPAARETLTSLAVPIERTRFYSRLRTLRIAHGLTEFLRDCLAGIGGPRSLILDQVDHADQTDQEFISVLLRRLNPELLTLVIGTDAAGQRRAPTEPGIVLTTEALTRPPAGLTTEALNRRPTGPLAELTAETATQPLAEPLQEALARYAERCGASGAVAAPASVPALPPAAPAPPPAAARALPPAAARALPPATAAGDPSAGHRLAAAYVAGDGTDDAAELVSAYRGLPAGERERLHDARAAQLVAADEFSLRLGAIPYHREHGTDPSGAGADALREALLHCLDQGFYEATVDFGRRGRAVIDPRRQPELWWDFTMKMPTPLAALGRPAEAEEMYDEARATSTSSLVHMQAAYGTAMLYTRHHEQERRDDHRALGWINGAIVIAALLPDLKDRAINTVFNQNGLALIKSHLGQHEEALRLVNEGLQRLDTDLAPSEHRLHRSVLRYNRGQLYAGMGRLEEALADYDAVIGADPHYAEYHFDRGNLLRRLGRGDEALAEYETAMKLTPPFPELYYNRADLRSSQGDLDGALADFGYVLEIDPEYVDAYINRAGILMATGQVAAARRDVAAGLAAAPGDPHLLCLLGRLELEGGHRGAARAALDAATAADPAFSEAWATRAAVAFETGDPAGAVADLTRAIDLTPDPALLFNRGCAHQAMENWTAAEADFTSALESEPGDADSWLRRAACRQQRGDAEGAGHDLREFAALAPA